MAQSDRNQWRIYNKGFYLPVKLGAETDLAIDLQNQLSSGDHLVIMCLFHGGERAANAAWMQSCMAIRIPTMKKKSRGCNVDLNTDMDSNA